MYGQWHHLSRQIGCFTLMIHGPREKVACWWKPWLLIDWVRKALTRPLPFPPESINSLKGWTKGSGPSVLHEGGLEVQLQFGTFSQWKSLLLSITASDFWVSCCCRECWTWREGAFSPPVSAAKRKAYLNRTEDAACSHCTGAAFLHNMQHVQLRCCLLTFGGALNCIFNSFGLCRKWYFWSKRRHRPRGQDSRNVAAEEFSSCWKERPFRWNIQPETLRGYVHQTDVFWLQTFPFLQVSSWPTN